MNDKLLLSQSQTNIPFINKYQPQYFYQFEQLEKNVIQLLETLIKMNNLNILLIGDPGSGKTSLIYSIILFLYDFNLKSIFLLNN